MFIIQCKDQHDGALPFPGNFDDYDRNSDGNITMKEFADELGTHLDHSDDTEVAFQAVDINGNAHKTNASYF